MKYNDTKPDKIFTNQTNKLKYTNEGYSSPKMQNYSYEENKSPFEDDEFNDVIKFSVERVSQEQARIKELEVIKALANKQVVLKNKYATRYFVFNVHTAMLVNVTKKDFKRRDGRVLKIRHWLVKYQFGVKDIIEDKVSPILRSMEETTEEVGVQKRDSDSLLKDSDNDDIVIGTKYKAQGLTEVMQNFQTIITGLAGVTRVVSMAGKVVDFAEENSYKLKRLGMDILSLLASGMYNISQAVSGNFSVYSIISMLINLGSVYFSVSDMCKNYKGFRKESLEAFSIASASIFLPPKMVEILKRMQLFSSERILDKPGVLLSVFEGVMNFFSVLMEYVPDVVKSYIPQSFLGFFDFRPYCMLFRMRKVYDEWQKDLRVMIQDEFRERVKDLKVVLDERMKTYELAHKSKQILMYINNFMKCYKAVKAYEETARIEPSCFVFEGGPGVFKSTHANAVTRVMRLTHYSHVTKSALDGKDFYDTYNNETIFRMDDVGQQAKSQWRNIINLVSPTKLPLDCASVDLKDTVYFSSEIMFLTTNNFMKLTGFTSQDGVSDMEALFRRGYVFDYYDVKRDVGSLTGNIYFKHYDQKAKVFVNDFPQDFKNYLVKMRVFIPTFSDASDQDELLVWMTTIIEGMKRMKSEQYDKNVMPNEQIDRIRAKNVFLNPIVDVPIVNYLGEGKTTGENPSYDRDWRGVDLTVPVSCSHFSGYTYDSIRGMVKKGELNPELLTVHERDDPSYFTYFFEIFVSFKDYLMEILTAQLSKLLMLLGSIEMSEYIGLLCAASIVVSVLIFFKVYKHPTFLKHRDNIVIGSAMAASTLGVRLFTNLSGYKSQTIIPPVVQEYVQTVRDADYERNRHPTVGAVVKQHFLCRLATDKKIELCYCLISGKYIIVPNHACPYEKAQLTVFRDHDMNNILIDNMVVNKRYRNVKNDLAIWSLPVGYPSPMKDLSFCFKDTVEVARDLIFENNVIPVERIKAAGGSSMMYEIQESYYNRIDNPLYYGIHFPGMCGSLLLSEYGNIMGMHLAGSNIERQGVSILWSKEVRAEIAAVLKQPNGLMLDTEISPKVFQDMSGIKLQAQLSSSTPIKTKLIPSPLYGVFDIDRMPANLAPYGCHTVKTILKQAMIPIKTLNFEELEFAKKTVDIIIEPFGDLTDSEVIGGTELLARINKDSSNGHFPLKTKEECFDYENNEMKPEFEKLYKEFLEKMSNDLVKQKDIVFIESVKDELRSISKKEPRTFRMCSVAMQFASKKLFGKMVENIIKAREFNKIMIGVNPFKDWKDIYKKLVPDATFDGDAKSFDKKMLGQVQQYVNESILSKYTGEYPDLARKLLELLIYSVVCGNDDVFMMTHSLPSGCFLTAIINSIINRFYAAMWYKRYYELATPLSFYKNVADYNYGDDKMVSVLNPNLKDRLNALTMSEFFESIGIEFTNAQKTKINKPFNDLLEITFLKRHFIYHSGLQSIVGPLDTSTLYSGLSYLDSTKDVTQVLQDKIHNFQREMFLHEHLYEQAVTHLEKVCRERGVVFERLPESYLIALYDSGEYDREYNRKFGLLN